MRSLLFLFTLLTTPTFAIIAHHPITTCLTSKAMQQDRSQELQTLAKDDQADRKHYLGMSILHMQQLAINDLLRRKRVGIIFAEGCINSVNDYLAAALIYQHGETPDHFYQAFLWSKHAADLGSEQGRFFSALAMDRYLLNIGHKQLFGSQYFKPENSRCHCMQPVDTTYPDELRKQYSGRSLKENYQLMARMNGSECQNEECKMALLPTPQNSVGGVW